MLANSKDNRILTACFSLLTLVHLVQAQQNQWQSSIIQSWMGQSWMGQTLLGPKLEVQGYPPCDALISSGLADRVVVPASEEYEPIVRSWWAANARYRPWCFVLPESTQEVATVVNTLRDSGAAAGDWHIAIRSGGHSHPGSNNVKHGVTIDLSRLNSSSYDPDRNVASVRPGARWRQAYSDLEKNYNVTLSGGRDGGVGVGGFLLGGGISYHTPRVGLACDMIVNYEVVLANGSVVDANKDENPSLFRALKGGGFNFGIVTRFDIEAIPAVNMVYETTIYSSDHSQAVSDAMADFANRQEQIRDDALITLYTHNLTASNATMSILSFQVNTQGDVNSPAFDMLHQIPAISRTRELHTYADIASGEVSDSSVSIVGSAMSFISTRSMLRRSVAIHDDLISRLTRELGAGNFATLWFYQPLPKHLDAFGEQNHGVRNVMGLERLSGDAVLWIGSVSVAQGNDPAMAIGEAALVTATRRIREISVEEHAEADFLYLNYAHPFQDPFASYGPENVAFIKKVASQYDPEGFWQAGLSGGFKISKSAV